MPHASTRSRTHPGCSGPGSESTTSRPSSVHTARRTGPPYSRPDGAGLRRHRAGRRAARRPDPRAERRADHVGRGGAPPGAVVPRLHRRSARPRRVAAASGDYRVEHYGADLVDFVDRVVGSPAVLVGHSLGGLVSAYVAGRHPDRVRAAFLEDPPIYLGDRDAYSSTIFAAFFPVAVQVLGDLRARSADVAEYEALAHAIPSMTGEGTLADELGPEKTRLMAETLHAFDQEAFVAAIDGSLWAAFDVDTRIEVPVRLLHAERDLGAAFFPEHEEHFRKTHPFASVDLVPGATHGIHEDHLEVFVAELERFLATV